MTVRQLAVAAALALVAGATFAQTDAASNPHPSFSTRAQNHEERVDHRQQARIQAGEANGSVTPKEQARLEKQQYRIHQAQKRADANGHVSPQEAAHIQEMQDRANKNIYDQKHDAQGTVTSPTNK